MKRGSRKNGWIKLWKDMVSDPRLIAAAKKLQTTYEVYRHTPGGPEALSNNESIAFLCNAVTGALVTLWCHADEHIRDDDTLEISSDSLDAVVRLEGFFAALPRQWVAELDDGRIILPGYCEKNSLITKRKRAIKSNARVARWRGLDPPQDRCVTTRVSGGVTSSHVTQSSSALDKDIDRDLKERERARAGARPEPKRSGRGKAQSPLVPLPDDLMLTEAMRSHANARAPGCDAEAWFQDFCAHHRAHGKRMRDWGAAWRTWVARGVQFGYPKLKEGNGASRLPSLNG
jgi:hypothetical protein